MKVISGSATVMLDQSDGDQRHRVVKTDAGYLITSRSRDMVGARLVAEWLHKTEEAALACAEAVIASTAAFRGIQRGLPTGRLFAEMERASRRHSELCDRLDDQPLVGTEVRALREALLPE